MRHRFAQQQDNDPRADLSLQLAWAEDGHGDMEIVSKSLAWLHVAPLAMLAISFRPMGHFINL